MVTKSFTILVMLFLNISISSAKFNGQVTFTSSEQLNHQSEIETILEEVSLCSRESIEHHQSFYRQYGVSPFYNGNSAYSKLNWRGKVNFLKSRGLPTKLVEQIKIFSSMSLTLKCLKRGFSRAGQESYWEKIELFTKNNGVNGLALQHGLQSIGWKVLYWNPLIDNNKDWDEEEKKRNSENTDRFWGYHHYRWTTVQKEKKYYFNHVDDYEYLVNFGQRTPRSFSKIPFFVGTAHTGYHVFPGTFGQVIEHIHQSNITESNSVSILKFNPLKKTEGPHGNFKTGLIAIPPGYLSSAKTYSEPPQDNYNWFK